MLLAWSTPLTVLNGVNETEDQMSVIVCWYRTTTVRQHVDPVVITRLIGIPDEIAKVLRCYKGAIEERVEDNFLLDKSPECFRRGELSCLHLLDQLRATVLRWLARLCRWHRSRQHNLGLLFQLCNEQCRVCGRRQTSIDRSELRCLHEVCFEHRFCSFLFCRT